MVSHTVGFSVDWRYIHFLRHMAEEEDFNRSEWLENQLDELIEEHDWTYDE